jgi:hypothetical protein
MSPAAFRKLALAQPGASEGSHGGHPDFRANGKVFASLGFKDKDTGMVNLTPEQQEMLVAAEPAIFSPIKGAWGLRGYTSVHIPAADTTTMKSALAMAVRKVSSPTRRVATAGGPTASRQRKSPASRLKMPRGRAS